MSKAITPSKTTITLEVDIDEYQLGNKYESVTFEITSGRGKGTKGKGRRFNTEVGEDDEITWTGKKNPNYIDDSNYKIEIREVSPKEELGYLNLLKSIEYKGNNAIGVIKGGFDIGVLEFYNITIRMTINGHTFPDFTIDPVLRIHR